MQLIKNFLHSQNLSRLLHLLLQVLCDQNIESFHWDKISTNQLVKDYLEDAVVGGIESDSLLYIGRIFHEGVFKIGKVFPPSSPFSGFRGWYNFNDTQYKTDDFEILKYKSLPSPSKCQWELNTYLLNGYIFSCILLFNDNKLSTASEFCFCNSR